MDRKIIAILRKLCLLNWPYVCSNGTGLLEEERTESPVSPKSEEIEPEVEIEQDDIQIMPTEMEALDEDKDEPKMEEYETELQVEEPGKLLINLKVLPKICSRRQLQILPLFQK